MWLKLDHTYNKSAEKMNQLFDQILIICSPNEQQREELKRVFEDYIIHKKELHGEAERRLDRDTVDDTLPRFEFGDIEED